MITQKKHKKRGRPPFFSAKKENTCFCRKKDVRLSPDQKNVFFSKYGPIKNQDLEDSMFKKNGFVICVLNQKYWDFTTKMDGENKGKPPLELMIWGLKKKNYFWKHPYLAVWREKKKNAILEVGELAEFI